MLEKARKPVLLVLLILGLRTCGFALSLTKVELELAFLPEYNRSFYYSWDMAASGCLEFNDCFTLSGGTALGKIRGEQSAGVFAAAGYDLPFFRRYFPLHLKFAYMYNKVFEASTHTLLPTASVQWRYFSFSMGPALRFTLFDGSCLRETALSFLARVNFYNTEKAAGGIGLGNTEAFEVRHQGAYSLCLHNRFSISKLISIASEMEVAISGNVGRIASVYGLAFKQGVIFTW
ncbi:MAG: hypothetical protein LBK63_02670 [Treponema sp.]|jgi:hypothetical protein|nr:hypothetical protein [Treponema sp.]